MFAGLLVTQIWRISSPAVSISSTLFSSSVVHPHICVAIGGGVDSTGVKRALVSKPLLYTPRPGALDLAVCPPIQAHGRPV